MPAKLKKTFKSTILYAWIFSYILAVSLPFIFSIATLLHSQKVYERSVISSSKTTLSSMGENVYSQLSYVENFATKLATNNYVTDLASLSEEDELSSQDYENIYQLSSLLSNDIFFNTGDYLFRPYVYFHNLDKIVGASNSFSPDEFYSMLSAEESDTKSFTKNDLNNFLSRWHKETFLRIPGENPKLFYALTVPAIYSSQSAPVTILVRINLPAMLNNASNLYAFDEGNLLIYDDENNLILSEGPFDLSEEIQNIHIKDNRYKDYSVIESTAVSNGWKFVYILPRDKIFSQISIMQGVYTGIFILTLIITVLVIITLVRKNYKPLANVMNTFNISKKKAGINEFDLLSGHFKDISQTNIELHKRDTEKTVKIKQHQLANLLLGYESVEADTEIILPDENYVVALFALVSETPEPSTDHSARFLLRQIITHIISEHSFGNVSTTINGDCCYVFYLDDSASAPRLYEMLKCVVYGAHKNFNYFGYKIQCSISDIHSGQKELTSAYHEALDILATKKLSPANGIFYFSDLEESAPQGYHYPLSKEQTILALLKDGDFDLLSKELTELFEVNFKRKNVSLDYARCLLLDLLNSVLKSYHENSERDITLNIDIKATIRFILNCTDISVAINSVVNVFKTYCDEVKLQNLGNSDELSYEIISYIKANYTNPEMSVTSIADNFRMNRNYLSKLFKEQQNINLHDFINEIRVQKAKSLLANTNMSLGEICDSTGFGSYRTFIRVFKQTEGVTALEYKKLASSEKNEE